MSRNLILCFILIWTVAACKSADVHQSNLQIDPASEPLAGRIEALRPICDAGDGECAQPTGSEVDLEFAVAGSCTDGSSFDSSFSERNRLVIVYARDYPAAPQEGVKCPAIAAIKHIRLTLTGLVPPFDIHFDGTRELAEVEDFATWTNGIVLPEIDWRPDSISVQ
jgi:hypothetical protein